MDFYESALGISLFFFAGTLVMTFLLTIARLRNAARKRVEVSDGTDEIMWE
jgi:hypothetical protein